MRDCGDPGGTGPCIFRNKIAGLGRMKLSEFDYSLPGELIAQDPLEARDSSRLMVLDRETGETETALFRDLPRYLDCEDHLVVNDSRVIPARLQGRKSTGA